MAFEQLKVACPIENFVSECLIELSLDYREFGNVGDPVPQASTPMPPAWVPEVRRIHQPSVSAHENHLTALGYAQILERIGGVLTSYLRLRAKS